MMATPFPMQTFKLVNGIAVCDKCKGDRVIPSERGNIMNWKEYWKLCDFLDQYYEANAWI
jgi:hypothetical protein